MFQKNWIDYNTEYNPHILRYNPDQTAAAVTNARNSASACDTFVTDLLAVPLHDQASLYLADLNLEHSLSEGTNQDEK
jgi:hypothetical protein